MPKEGYRPEAVQAWSLVVEARNQLDARGYRAYRGDVKATPGLLASNGLIVTLCYLDKRSYGSKKSLLARQLAKIATPVLREVGERPVTGTDVDAVVEALVQGRSLTLAHVSRTVLEHLRWMRAFVDLDGGPTGPGGTLVEERR
ncbi:type III-B CRISPR module-associated protein Cmr5 [Aciditerrimonas ferrireducens]|uniref:type III-B CRISPR module-associated protein Cmr5 n=1 Tax=Aciditerrimonas ferrireducens TaxID=667306 RepID=UPI0020048109|nr:type III-B CRISPR module-associated protein Cmr5 [Aciditerrimonas ferrireducens]MCK4176165.1 hypothetical protein [Aciditerrimonas ferrireducens]